MGRPAPSSRRRWKTSISASRGLMDRWPLRGGMVTIDFKEKGREGGSHRLAILRRRAALCVVNTGGDHGDLTDDYAAIRKGDEAVAAHFGACAARGRAGRWKVVSARFAGPAATAPCCARCIVTMKTPACSSRRRRFAAAICPRPFRRGEPQRREQLEVPETSTPARRRSRWRWALS